jgi:hypothetical protein
MYRSEFWNAKDTFELSKTYTLIGFAQWSKFQTSLYLKESD